jgi:hypothetical protein
MAALATEQLAFPNISRTVFDLVRYLTCSGTGSSALEPGRDCVTNGLLYLVDGPLVLKERIAVRRRSLVNRGTDFLM